MSFESRIASTAGPLSDLDRHLLRRAIELGRNGWGRVNPNPMVGAVLARDGEVLSEGYHEVFGGPHAEITALAGADDARGATLYSSLEPCNHAGKTPPCTEAIQRAGVVRVVYWAAEPGTKAGGGGECLRRTGVLVDGPVGEWTDWAAENPFFFRDPAVRRPYLALKLAMSLDGSIAPGGGHRVWLTGPEARSEVHRLRAGFDAVLVGSGTWQADDPHLTARGDVVPRVPPVPVLLDTRGRATVALRALRGSEGARRPIVVTSPREAARLGELLGDKAEVAPVRQGPGGLDLEEVFCALGERGVDSVLCEGGGILAASLLAEGLVDRIYLFLAPLLIGSGGVPAFPVHAGDPVGPSARYCRGWQSRLDPVRFGHDTLVVLDRGA